MDVARLRASFERVAPHAPEFAKVFYARLFALADDTRGMFPDAMPGQRDKFISALVRIVSLVEDLPRLTPYLQGLGRDHCKFDVITEHYDVVGTALLVTVAEFDAEHWNDDLAGDWTQAYQAVAAVMTGAMDAHRASGAPDSWEAVVREAELRTYDTSVLHVEVLTRPALEWVPGQSVSVEVPGRHRGEWRWYSPAGLPSSDSRIEFHVRLTRDATVSMALTAGDVTGTRLRIGPSAGTLTLQESGRPLLMVAGSTGLAPCKAILRQIAAGECPRPVTLWYAARARDDLYDLTAMEKMAAEHPWVTLMPVVTRELGDQDGGLAGVVARAGDWRGRDAYIAGPSEMVSAVSEALAGTGVPEDHIRTEDFGWTEPRGVLR